MSTPGSSSGHSWKAQCRYRVTSRRRHNPFPCAYCTSRFRASFARICMYTTRNQVTSPSHAHAALREAHHLVHPNVYPYKFVQLFHTLLSDSSDIPYYPPTTTPIRLIICGNGYALHTPRHVAQQHLETRKVRQVGGEAGGCKADRSP